MVNNRKIRYWLSTTYQSDYHSLKVKPKSPAGEEKNMDNCLWFWDDEEGKAKDFLRNLKRFIKDNYPYPDRAKWLTEEWVLKDDM